MAICPNCGDTVNRECHEEYVAYLEAESRRLGPIR